MLESVRRLGFHIEPNGELPGRWIPDPADAENVKKMQYQGPLIGRTLEAELAITTYNGNDRNEFRQVRCQIPDCAVKYPEVKHITNMLGKRA